MIKKILYFVSILIIIILIINILIIIIIHGFEYIKCHNIQLNLNSIPKLHEILVCYSPDKNKRHVFFYTCPYAFLGVKSLRKKIDFSLSKRIVHTVRDRKKISE